MQSVLVLEFKFISFLQNHFCPLKIYLPDGLCAKPGSIHASIHVSTRPYLCSSMYLFIHACIYPSLCLSMHPSTHASIHPCIHPPAHPSIHLSIHIPLYPSIIHPINAFTECLPWERCCMPSLPSGNSRSSEGDRFLKVPNEHMITHSENPCEATPRVLRESLGEGTASKATAGFCIRR